MKLFNAPQLGNHWPFRRSAYRSLRRVDFSCASARQFNFFYNIAIPFAPFVDIGNEEGGVVGTFYFEADGFGVLVTVRDEEGSDPYVLLELDGGICF